MGLSRPLHARPAKHRLRVLFLQSQVQIVRIKYKCRRHAFDSWGGCHARYGMKMTMPIDGELLEGDGQEVPAQPAQDILIAACAIRAGVPVLAADKHFQAIPLSAVISF